MVTIVITAHNRSAVLPRAIASAVAQTYSSIEVLVMDDTSNEDNRKVTEAAAASHPNRVVRYLGIPACSVSAARNAGVKAAKGDYVAFLDDDDELLPKYADEVTKAFVKLDEAYGVVLVGFVLIDSLGWKSYSQSWLSWSNAFGNGCTFRREIFANSNLWFDEGFGGQEDLDFGIRFSQHYKAFIIDQPLRNYYITLPSFRRRVTSRTSDRDNSYRYYMKIFEKNYAAFAAAGPGALAIEHRRAGIIAGENGNMPAVRQHLRSALRARFSLQTFLYWLASLAGFYSFTFFDVSKAWIMRAWRVFISNRNHA